MQIYKYSKYGVQIYNKFISIDWFTNIFKFYAYLLNKGCLWQPESLPEVCPT